VFRTINFHQGEEIVFTKASKPTVRHVAFSLEIKRPGREAGHVALFSGDIKNPWSCATTRSSSIHGVVKNYARTNSPLYLFRLSAEAPAVSIDFIWCIPAVF